MHGGTHTPPFIIEATNGCGLQSPEYHAILLKFQLNIFVT